MAGLGLFIHMCIQRLRGLHFLCRRLGSHRQIALGLAVFHDGGDIGLDPVVITVFATVLHNARPGIAMRNGAPHVLEGSLRHVWMPDHVMGLPDQLFILIAADANERGVAVGNFAFGVCHGHQQFIAREIVIILGYGEVQTHTHLQANGVHASQRCNRQGRRSSHKQRHIRSQAFIPRYLTSFLHKPAGNTHKPH